MEMSGITKVDFPVASVSVCVCVWGGIWHSYTCGDNVKIPSLWGHFSGPDLEDNLRFSFPWCGLVSEFFASPFCCIFASVRPFVTLLKTVLIMSAVFDSAQLILPPIQTWLHHNQC